MTFIILSIILAIVGIIGAVVPALPGPVLSWAAFFLLSFNPSTPFSTTQIVIAAGVWGVNIGLVISIIGLPFGPQGLLGVIVWPFLGALVGEYLKSHDMKISAHTALGAFIGFLCGSGLKLIYGIIILLIIIMSLLRS